MSFAIGFEKTAASLNPARLLGAAGGAIQKGTQKAVGAVKGFAAGQRASRIEGFRATSAGKTNPIGTVSANTAAAKASAAGKPLTTSQSADMAKNKRVGALSRLDRAKDSKNKNNMSFFQKHPVATATGAFLGARHLMKDDQPQPPPQVVQY